MNVYAILAWKLLLRFKIGVFMYIVKATGTYMYVVFGSHCSTEYGSTELYTPQGAEKV